MGSIQFFINNTKTTIASGEIPSPPTLTDLKKLVRALERTYQEEHGAVWLETETFPWKHKEYTYRDGVWTCEPGLYLKHLDKLQSQIPEGGLRKRYHVSWPPSDSEGCFFSANSPEEALLKYFKNITEKGEDLILLDLWDEIRGDILIEEIPIHSRLHRS